MCMGTENKRSRICYMDTCKGLLIFLMVAGHCLALYRGDAVCNALYWFIYSFHMPVFIFISGYFSKNTDKPVWKLFRELILPMIPFELLYWVIHLGGGERISIFHTHLCILVYGCAVFLQGSQSDCGQNPGNDVSFCFCWSAGGI